MTNVYRLVPNSARFKVLCVVPEEATSAFDDFDGTPLDREWAPVRVELSEEGQRTDFPSLRWSVPVLSERAWDVLKSIAGRDTQPYPLDGPEPLVALNVLQATCLDEEHSDLTRLDDGRIMEITSYVFDDDCLGERTIFKLPEGPGEVLVTDRFREAVERHGLCGASFQPLDRPARPAQPDD